MEKLLSGAIAYPLALTGNPGVFYKPEFVWCKLYLVFLRIDYLRTKWQRVPGPRIASHDGAVVTGDERSIRTRPKHNGGGLDERFSTWPLPTSIKKIIPSGSEPTAGL